jgi:hypothetical protein
VKLTGSFEKDGYYWKLISLVIAIHLPFPPNKRFTLYWVKKKWFRPSRQLMHYRLSL